MAGKVKDFIKITELNKQFEIDGDCVDILNNINLEFEEGEFITIVGASGCGKSTLLRMIAGMEKIESGSIVVADRKVVNSSVECGMIFQEPRLLPWVNVEKNIEFGLPKGINRSEKKEKIKEMISLVGLEGFQKALPKQLSGGMQQRVSIARGLINNPKVLLLDEPFGALDAITRINMQNEILRIWERERKTMVLVTHDIDEAIFLGDKIVVLSRRPGQVKLTIEVKLPRPRDRSLPEFISIRKKIYQEFFEETDLTENIEYYI